MLAGAAGAAAGDTELEAVRARCVAANSGCSTYPYVAVFVLQHVGQLERPFYAAFSVFTIALSPP
jgi:hypothetical protein